MIDTTDWSGRTEVNASNLHRFELAKERAWKEKMLGSNEEF